MNDSLTHSPNIHALFEAIDAMNAQDPNKETTADGQQHPKEWLYGRRMSAVQESYAPDASDELRIACRAQHIRRWIIPRTDYPEGKQGYYRWRTELAAYHAKLTTELMAEQGYSDASQQRVANLLQKRNLKQDAETQTLEDIICLVFIQYYVADFADKHDSDKLIDILQKTWAKMSHRGQRESRKLLRAHSLRELFYRALMH